MKGGLGVDSRIPPGRCRAPRIALGRCEQRWRGFVHNASAKETPCNCWTKVGLGEKSLPATSDNFFKPWFIVYVGRGRVIGFDFDLEYVDRGPSSVR